MLAASRERILADLPRDALVLDVGGWAKPLARADWVLDLMPYSTRGLYGEPDPDPERFTEATWVVRDMCDHEAWPFADDQFDFAVCSHTLEDVRDPIRVCEELRRVARAGYIEVPARSQEQTFGVHGPWVGWSHHHWLVDIHDGSVEFVLKPHLLHGRPEFWVDREWTDAQPPDRLVSTLWWRGSFKCSERVYYEPDELHRYLASVAEAYGAELEAPGVGRAAAGRRAPAALARLRGALRRPG
jgi:hypothetical protein